MATLNLARVWVNRYDTGQAVSAFSAVARDQSYTMAGEVRTYAGGRQRSITTAGERGRWQVTLVRVSAATLVLLRSWKGITVQVRDARGQRFVGVFREVPVIEHREYGEYSTTLTLEAVTVVDGV